MDWGGLGRRIKGSLPSCILVDRCSADSSNGWSCQRGSLASPSCDLSFCKEHLILQDLPSNLECGLFPSFWLSLHHVIARIYLNQDKSYNTLKRMLLKPQWHHLHCILLGKTSHKTIPHTKCERYRLHPLNSGFRQSQITRGMLAQGGLIYWGPFLTVSLRLIPWLHSAYNSRSW